MDSSAYNAWQWVSLSPLPTWVLWSLAVLVAFSAARAIWGLRGEPNRRLRFGLAALRVLAAAVALFFLLEPGLRQLQVMRVKNRVAVLVDRSASMGFPFEPGGASRYARVAQYLESVVPSLAALKDRFLFETYALDGDLTPVAPEALKAQLPRGARTDLLAAIRAVKAGQGASSRKLSGVVLFSDGADNGELKGGLGGQAASELQALGVPVSTVLVGQDAVRDVALGQVKVDDFAFVRSSITVEIEVQARGYKGRQAAVVLGREGQVVSTQTVTFKSEDDLQTVTFSFTPDQTGRFAYTVNVPLLEEEAVAENNARSFSLKVIRDRIRVLLVVGRPSWDERFLRGRLKQDANVDLVSFYILRTLSDDPNVRNPDRELSLIPFPMEEIFDTKLHTFDVVVFQNFGYTDPQLSIERYEKNLERYVFNGGALVVIGGDHAFGESR
ncbi:MAG TPA: vWA domain-containing protein, partial [Myxococcaceae bacterium]|nr:vWA domain-containing protein [Myxococcaceae bacterium]